VTQPSIADRPPAGSVEAFVGILTSRPEVETYLESCGLAIVQALVDGAHATPLEKIAQVRNALTAVTVVRKTLDAGPRPAAAPGFDYSRADDDPQVVRPHSPRVPLRVGTVVGGGELVDATPRPGTTCEQLSDDDLPETPALTASGLTPAADLSRGVLAGTTPVVVYFSFGHGQTDPGTGQKLLDHYVTVVAPTYEQCREAMLASRFGREWSMEYLAGRTRTTDAVSRWTEHEVIIAPGTDRASAAEALMAANRVLFTEPVSESR